MSARDNILRRIREANRNAGYIPKGREPAVERLRHPVRGPLPSMNWEPVARFRQRCLAMMSTIDDVGMLTDVPAAVARYLRGLGLPEIGVCWPEFATLDWGGAGLRIEPRPAAGSDKVGITGTYCALAENGTLMLLSGEGTPATTSLLPDTHIAIVPVSRVVSAMEDGWDLLRRELGTVPRQVNFVSGPSRTADIELTLVLGAHGPIRVHVIIVAA
jgi:L-lactate dehydrogenase complex protein LldG